MENKCFITNCRSDYATDGKKVCFLFLEYQEITEPRQNMLYVLTPLKKNS